MYCTSLLVLPQSKIIFKSCHGRTFSSYASGPCKTLLVPTLMYTISMGRYVRIQMCVYTKSYIIEQGYCWPLIFYIRLHYGPVPKCCFLSGYRSAKNHSRCIHWAILSIGNIALKMQLITPSHWKIHLVYSMVDTHLPNASSNEEQY